MKSVRALWGRTAGFLGISFFTREFLRFVRVHLLFTAAVNLSGIFLSIFMVKAGGTMADICLYYLCAYAFEMAGNLFVPWLTSHFSKTLLNRVGMLLFLGSYLVLLTLQERVIAVFPVVAILGALGGSLYWLSYHHFCVTYTEPEGRQTAMSFIGLLANIIVLIVPLISGLITAQMQGMTGYIVIFSVSSVCFLLAIMVSRKLPGQKTPRPPHIVWNFLKTDFKRVPIYTVALTNTLYGFREGVYSYLFNLLIFSQIDNEFVLSLNITGRSLLAILTFLLIGKFMTPKRRIRWNFYSMGSGLLLSAGLLLWLNAPYTMFVYVIDAIFVTLAGNSLQFCTYEAADAVSTPQKPQQDVVMSVRNASLNLGRVLGIVFFLVILGVSGGTQLLIWPLVVLNAVGLLSAVTMRISSRSIAREKSLG